MDIDKFKSVLTIGETSSVEFKRCGGEVEYDVFESICAFLNRFGGDVYLGVLNDGTVKGVNATNAAAMMKNIINVVGNPNVFKPSPYIEVDSFVWEGKTVIRIERERMYTSNPCNPMRDGRITPENVHPKAKNPVIAGFFREIGRADRLGSGIRNLYKYCKDYGGSDPVFTEGNEFVISVPLKKLDPIRFPFEKPSIAPKKPSIQGVLDRLNLVRPTYENIVSLYEKLDDGEIFGRKRIMELIELSNGSAGDLLKIMLKNKLLDTIKGCGKGKYRFVSFSASVDSNSPALAKKITGAVVPVTEPVTAPVNEPLCSAEFLLSIIRKNPGKRKRELVSLTGLRPWNVKRLLEGPLKNRIEFRGACRTGGYYVIDNLGNPV